MNGPPPPEENMQIRDIARPGIKIEDPQELRRLREEVASLLHRNSYNFPGAQPVSFARQHLEELRKEDYFVCEKSDGIRYLLYLTHDVPGDVKSPKRHYLIDRKNDYWYIDNQSLHFPLAVNEKEVAFCHSGTLIDGELVMDRVGRGPEVEPKFLVFDLLALDGKPELMGKSLDKRLAYFRDHLLKAYKDLFKQYPEELRFQPFKVEMKEMQFSYAIQLMFKEVLPRLKHDNDGLIFTCRTSPYQFGTDPHILKWKAPHDNTVDFRLRLNFPLFHPTPSEESDEDSSSEAGDEPYVDYDSVPDARLYVYNGNQGGKPSYTEFSDPLYLSEQEWEELKAMGDPLQDRVVECALDDQGRWRLYRFRDDKNEANHVSTVNSVLASIRDGVTEEELLGAAGGIRECWKMRDAKERGGGGGHH